MKPKAAIMTAWTEMKLLTENKMESVDQGSRSHLSCFFSGYRTNTQSALNEATTHTNTHLVCLPATNKVRMLEDGVTERIKSLLRTDMPPVQFKLLGTLRMMVDGQGEGLLHWVQYTTWIS